MHPWQGLLGFRSRASLHDLSLHRAIGMQLKITVFRDPVQVLADIGSGRGRCRSGRTLGVGPDGFQHWSHVLAGNQSHAAAGTVDAIAQIDRVSCKPLAARREDGVSTRAHFRHLSNATHTDPAGLNDSSIANQTDCRAFCVLKRASRIETTESQRRRIHDVRNRLQTLGLSRSRCRGGLDGRSRGGVLSENESVPCHQGQTSHQIEPRLFHVMFPGHAG